MTAFQHGPGTGGDFLIGTKYYQFKFSPAPGALLFFRGDLLYHAVGRYKVDDGEEGEDQDLQAGHTTLILEPCGDMSVRLPSLSPAARGDEVIKSDEVTKPLAEDLMGLSG